MANSSKTVSTYTLQKYKNENKKITALTAYDYSTAKYIDEAGLDIVLVGDSLAMVALGYDTTHKISVEEMLVFTKAVSRAVQRAMVIVDMPFMSYQLSEEQALANAARFVQEGGAKAVKIEGASDHIIKVVKRVVESGIPVLAHLGFTPQFLHTLGGYHIQGKNLENTKEILNQALKLQEAGAFAVVLEMVPEEPAKVITGQLDIPTIGIGAGRYCSGQILVTDDVLGKYSDFTPKFARKFVDLASNIKSAVSEYKTCVENNSFPSEDEIFKLSEQERERLNDVYPIRD